MAISMVVGLVGYGSIALVGLVPIGVGFVGVGVSIRFAWWVCVYLVMCFVSVFVGFYNILLGLWLWVLVWFLVGCVVAF